MLFIGPRHRYNLVPVTYDLLSLVAVGTTPAPGHDSPPPRAGTQPVTDWFVETPTTPTQGQGSPPPRAGTQPVTDGFVETPTLATPGLETPSWKMERQPGSDVHDPPVRTGPVAGAVMKGPKLGWDRKGDGFLVSGHYRVRVRVSVTWTLPRPSLDRTTESWPRQFKHYLTPITDAQLTPLPTHRTQAGPIL